jgi:hypothetical protein
VKTQYWRKFQAVLAYSFCILNKFFVNQKFNTMAESSRGRGSNLGGNRGNSGGRSGTSGSKGGRTNVNNPGKSKQNFDSMEDEDQQQGISRKGNQSSQKSGRSGSNTGSGRGKSSE